MIAAIAGSQARTPTISELEALKRIVDEREISTLRHRDCVGSDRAAGAWLKARDVAKVEKYSADWQRYAGHGSEFRNRAMFAGGDSSELGAGRGRGAARLLVCFAADPLADATVRFALDRGVEVIEIPPVAEPRPWNMHHGPPPLPLLYVGRECRGHDASPLGNPDKVEIRDGETRLTAWPRARDAYKRWLWPSLQDTASPASLALASVTADHYLGCWCWPAPCHAEVIVAAWRWRRAHA
jgi:hypothetical protein